MVSVLSVSSVNIVIADSSP